VSGVKAVGLDAVEIDRLEGVIERHGERFFRRVFTDAERAASGASSRPSHYFAGRFAAKEAVLKVLGTGWAQGLGFTDVEILRLGGGAPEVHLHGPAAELADSLGFTRVLVSITHTRRTAHAVAIAT
jgi:holo-[acyl-carrier protein] synthase